MRLLVPLMSATQAQLKPIPGRKSKGDKRSLKNGSKLIKCCQGLKETCQGVDLEDRLSVTSRSMGATEC
jgi:hypothetical protein